MPEREFRFPEAILEIGKDDDHSYNSLKTSRQSDGRLKIDLEGWGISEHGLQLMVGPGRAGRVLELRILGRCGSVFHETWIKASYSRIVEKAEEDQAQQIEYCAHVPAEVGEIDIRLRVKKKPYERS